MKYRLLPALLLTTACLSVDNESGIVLDDLFNQTGEAYFSGAADYPAAQAAAVGAVGDFRLLPASLSATQKAIYLSGSTVNGNLFLFQKRRFAGLTPNKTYQASLSIGYITDYQDDCTTGPGPLTVIKAGVSATEPITTTDAQGIVRFNLDKGDGTSKGLYTVHGTIQNGLAGCPTAGSFVEQATLPQSQATPLVVDADGGFWIFIGTQSSAVGNHQIYFTGLRLTLR